MHRISRDKVIYTMSGKNEAVLRVEPGERILFETEDALHGQIKAGGQGFEGLDWGRVNPATGPVYINGAQPGDVLTVRIEEILVESTGVVACGEGMGSLGHLLKGNTAKVMQIEGEMAHFSEDLSLPLNKMVGVIGTAPAKGEIPCGAPDFHGGNMDCKEIKEGATVLLPVNVPGALLAIGDLHAVMADGEAGVTGLEVAGSVKVTVGIIKNRVLPLPMVVNDSYVMTLASDEDLDIAVDMAASNMAEYLTKVECHTMNDAAMLISLVADVRICQVVDPKKTIRVEFPRKYLKVNLI